MGKEFLALWCFAIVLFLLWRRPKSETEDSTVYSVSSKRARVRLPISARRMCSHKGVDSQGVTFSNAVICFLQEPASNTTYDVTFYGTEGDIETYYKVLPLHRIDGVLGEPFTYECEVAHKGHK